MQILNLKGEVLLKGVDLGWTNLRNANLRAADLRKTNLRGADLRGADLRGADLRAADLYWADLSGSDLCKADLREADLREADLRGADLRYADLSGANLSLAILRKADLRYADLSGANLSSAILRKADLRYADLSGADLSGAVLPPPITPSEGEFLGYKKVRQADSTYTVITLRIPADAQRTSALRSRKCRASHVIVSVGGGGCSPTHGKALTYTPGATVTADSFDANRREDCTNGIHFFMTREEAEAYQP